MRINLLLDNKTDIRINYVNIDILADGTDERMRGDITNLDSFVCDNEAEEIVAHNILEYYPSSLISQIMSNWLKKLIHKGRLIIGCTDIDLVAKAIIEGKIDRVSLDCLIYGEQKHNWQFKKCALSCEKLCDWLENKGYKIIHKRFNKFNFVITCERI